MDGASGVATGRIIRIQKGKSGMNLTRITDWNSIGILFCSVNACVYSVLENREQQPLVACDNCLPVAQYICIMKF